MLRERLLPGSACVVLLCISFEHMHATPSNIGIMSEMLLVDMLSLQSCQTRLLVVLALLKLESLKRQVLREAHH